MIFISKLDSLAASLKWTDTLHMSHGNELLPKVIDKSQADIDAAIAAIKASEIEGDTKDFAISWSRRAAERTQYLHNYAAINITALSWWRTTVTKLDFMTKL